MSEEQDIQQEIEIVPANVDGTVSEIGVNGYEREEINLGDNLSEVEIDVNESS